MAQAGCFQSIQVCALRAGRLAASGAPLTGAGATNGYTGKAPVEVKIVPQYQAGVELIAENGCGTLAGYYTQIDQLKKYTIDFTLCDLDNELIELLTSDPIVTVSGQTVGKTSQRVGACNPITPNGVALEFWSKKWNSCAPPAGDLYWHWFFPRAYLTVGEIDMQNDFMKVPITGFAVENPNFGTGGWTTAPWPSAAGALNASWGVVSEPVLPTAVCGYTAVS